MPKGNVRPGSLTSGSPAGDRAQVLLIDDDSVFRWLLREILTQEGYDVWEAANGVQGVCLFQEVRPDIVLLDIVMPKMDGLETLRTIATFNPAAAVFLVSGATGATDHIDAARMLGAKGGFAKPFRLGALLDAIREQLVHGGSLSGALGPVFA